MQVKGLPWFFKEGSQKCYVSDKASYLVLDFEATAHKGNGPVDPNSELVLACWEIYRPGKSAEFKHCWGSEYEQQELANDISSVNFVVAHNAKYELQWLRRMGMELRDILVYCTMLGQWVLDGNEAKPRNLKAMARRYGLRPKIDLIALLWETGIETWDIPRAWLLEYCETDVQITRQIFERQRCLLEVNEQLHLALVRNLTAAALADIEFQGMTLDKEKVDAEYDRVLEEYTATSEELGRLSGGINLGSSKQLGELLFSKLGFAPPLDERGKPRVTGKGAISTDSAAISALLPTTDEQRHFLSVYKRWNKLDSLLTKNLDFFRKVCEEKDGKFYATFNQNITKTHRLSSSGRPLLFQNSKKAKGVQFQNLPREYKKLFWSGDEDWLIGESDAAQLEFRVAADMGRDDTAITEISDQVDIHTNTAKVFLEAGTQPEFIGLTLAQARQPAKPQTFKPLTYSGLAA